MAYLIALALLVVFVANVVVGAVGTAPFFDNVTEALMLFGAAISFSVAILRSEARAKEQKDQE